MNITEEDMARLHHIWEVDYVTYPGGPSAEERRDIAIATHLVDIYDRGYAKGYEDARVAQREEWY